MSGCAGAGREHSQAASPSRPTEIFHTTDIVLNVRMGVGRGSGISFSGSSNFHRLGEFCKIYELWETHRSHGCHSETGYAIHHHTVKRLYCA